MRRSDDYLPARREQGRGLSPWTGAQGLDPLEFFSGSPWQAMRRMQEDMDRLFGAVWGGQGQGALAEVGQQWAPMVDVSESEREWCIEAELPGVRRDDINVQVRNGHLIVSAEINQEREVRPGQGGQRQYLRRERRYGSFQRVFPLPQEVNEDAIRCEFSDGVLAVHLPKTEQAARQPRRIPIEAIDAYVESIPSETAAGRARTPAEIRMTEQGGNGHTPGRRATASAGAKGGEATTAGSRPAAAKRSTAKPGTSAPKSGTTARKKNT